MAIERNPFKEVMGADKTQQPNVIPMPIGGASITETQGPTFEVDDDGSVTWFADRPSDINGQIRVEVNVEESVDF